MEPIPNPEKQEETKINGHVHAAIHYRHRGTIEGSMAGFGLNESGLVVEAV